MVGGRVGKDTRRRLKGKNIELILQNVWKRQTFTEDCKEIFLKFSCVTTGLHAAQCRFQTRNWGFLTCAELEFIMIFFSSMNVIVYKLLVLSTSQVVYIRLKKVRFIASLFTSWSKERRAIGACNRCKVKWVRIIFFVRYYLPVFVYTTGSFSVVGYD